LGIDTCFKLKLKDRGFNDPDLGTGSAYMVEDKSYKEYLEANKEVTEEVSVPTRPLTNLCDRFETVHYVRPGSLCGKPGT
jgi:hypothetical protein